MKRIRLILAAAGLLLAAGAAAQPALVTRNGVTRFEIDGKPFVMFGGELHNSTSSSEQYSLPLPGSWSSRRRAGMTSPPWTT